MTAAAVVVETPMMTSAGCIDLNSSFDTPMFRQAVSSASDRTNELNAALKQLSAAGADWQAQEDAASVAMMRFAKAVASLHDDLAVSGELNRVASLLRDVVGELNAFRQVLVSQLAHCVLKPAADFRAGPVAHAKSHAKALGKWTANFDAALARKSSARRDNAAMARIDSDLGEAREQYHAAALTAALSLNTVHLSKQFEFTERLVAFLYAIKVHQHQGNELLAQCEPVLRSMSIHAEALRDRFEAERAPYDVLAATAAAALVAGANTSHTFPAHQLSPPADPDLPASPSLSRRSAAASLNNSSGSSINSSNDSAEKRTNISGYLFKRSHNIRKDWKRRFFTIDEGELRYSRTVSDESERFPLLLCTVREARDSDRPNSFEVVSPARVLTLMAEDDQMMRTWIKVIRNAIAASLNNQIAQPARRGRELAMSDSSRRAEAAASAHRRPQAAVIALLRKGDAANRLCADCGEPDPTWASISLGVLLCIECAGVHRRIGVHVTKVRSLELDTWPPCDTQLVARLGNAVTNAVFERAVSTDVVRGKPGVGADVLEAWIRAKYELRRFVGNPSPKRDHNALGHALCTAAALDDVRQVQALLALDPSIVDWRNGSTGPPLLSAAAGSVVVVPYDKLPVPYDSSDATTTRDEHKNLWQGAASLAYLLHRGAAFDVRGAGGVSVMHVLARRDSAPLLNAALVGGAMCDATDDNGRTPIDEAMRVQAADAVTFLRLAALAFPNGAEQHRHGSGNGVDDNEFLSSFRAFVDDERFQLPPEFDALLTPQGIDGSSTVRSAKDDDDNASSSS
jgi:hypothetical protein